MVVADIVLFDDDVAPVFSGLFEAPPHLFGAAEPD
jgi:hypothetical protein